MNRLHKTPGVLAIATGMVLITQQAAAADISADVESSLRSQDTTRVWVHLGEQADLSGAADLYTKTEKGRHVFETLNEIAKRTQRPILEHLDRSGVDYRSFWITNAIVVDVDRALLSWLSARADVERIEANPEVQMLRYTDRDGPTPEAASTIEWNVEAIGAPAVWAQGFTGQGVVVASADTGVEWNHPAIVDSYRGSDGVRVDHDYHWFDGIDGLDTPYDDQGHGTFTTGQMTGDDGANQIGVAPGAQWMACKNMNAAGFGTPESYIACFEFFVAPTTTRGQSPNPDLAPDVVNNSWGCPTYEGCDADTLLDVVNATQAAGVMLIVSAGNSGPGCTSVEDPPATYSEVLTVGAYDSNGGLAGFSSRGPSAYDRGMKPNLAAPGVSVRSAIPGGGYSNGWSGTSMASPEVAAAAALLWSAQPNLIGDIEGTRAILEGTTDATRGPRCGGQRGYGNNMWGTGKLNIPNALDAR